MATSLGYTPPTPAPTGVQHDVDDLLDALHESGLLRGLAGGVRAYPRLLLALLDAIDDDSVRSVIALAGSLRDLDPEQSERLADGVRRARAAAQEAASGEPEGPRALWRRLRDPDTRRGLSAALAVLTALGGSLNTK